MYPGALLIETEHKVTSFFPYLPRVAGTRRSFGTRKKISPFITGFIYLTTIVHM
jgi:hypothetical protein